MSVSSVFHIGINVTDMDRSVAFYRKLGFEIVQDVLMSEEDSRDTSACFGSEPSGGRVVFLRHGTDPKGFIFDLVQWDKPHPRLNPGDAYRATGIGRICLTAEKPEELLATLEAGGIKPLGPLATSELPSGGRYSVFAFHDPDGTIIEVISTSVERIFSVKAA
jgi:catechol 2,3-dioxygenase-like lactoylglutathione lyase family enzyme